jgi:hypothetical protein
MDTFRVVSCAHQVASRRAEHRFQVSDDFQISVLASRSLLRNQQEPVEASPVVEIPFQNRCEEKLQYDVGKFPA